VIKDIKVRGFCIISLKPLYQIEDAHQPALFPKIPEVEMQTLIPKTPQPPCPRSFLVEFVVPGCPSLANLGCKTLSEFAGGKFLCTHQNS
jgi:hypothetical protein